MTRRRRPSKPSSLLGSAIFACLAACFASACLSSSTNAGAPTNGSVSAAKPDAGTEGDASGGFVLSWKDDFDTLDSSLWQLQTFSWDGNLAQFTSQNAKAAGGILSINLTPEPTDPAKPFRGVEMRSVKTLTYGKVVARVRFAKGSGVVSGLVLIYTPYPADNWNEIDIEHLGSTKDGAQLNCQVYLGPPVPRPAAQSVTPTPDAQVVTLGFDAEADFHEYAMEWTPAGVRFTADGSLLRTWTKEIALMTLPQNILFTIWASSAAGWAGPISSSSAPTSADVDWIKVYTWSG